MVRTDDKGVTALRDRRFYLKLSGSCSQSVSTKRLQLLGSLEKHGNSDPGNSAVHPTEASAYNFQPIDMNSNPLSAADRVASQRRQQHKNSRRSQQAHRHPEV